MDDEWISAIDTLDFARSIMAPTVAQETLCSRAFDGLIRTHAKLLIWGNRRKEEVEVPPNFWWARGRGALEQNWHTGDFETWIDRTVHVRVYGVRFFRVDVEGMIGRKFAAPLTNIDEVMPDPASSADKVRTSRGGRRRSDFWNLLTVEVARRVFIGEIKPPLMAGKIRDDMLAWLMGQGSEPDKTTVDPFFKLLAKTLNKEHFSKE